MKNQVRISKKVLKGLFSHAITDFPNECCGFLYGQEDGERQIVHWEPVVNAKEGDKRRRFTIDPFDYMKAERRALEMDRVLLGIYHSHPLHPAIASEHDLAQAMPFFSYVIVSVYPDQIKEVRSWRLQDESTTFLEEIVNH